MKRLPPATSATKVKAIVTVWQVGGTALFQSNLGQGRGHRVCSTHCRKVRQTFGGAHVSACLKDLPERLLLLMPCIFVVYALCTMLADHPDTQSTTQTTCLFQKCEANVKVATPWQTAYWGILTSLVLVLSSMYHQLGCLARIHRKEMLLNCHRKMAVKRVVYVV